MPDRRQKAEEQEKENKETLKSNPKAKVNKHHINFLNKWWKLSYGREDMLEAVADLPRYIACSRVTQRPIFEFIDSKINANDALMVFAFADYYSFGIINSKLHWDWFVEKCSTLGGTFRYTADTVWDTFPWPQNPTQKQIENVGQAALLLHQARVKSLREHNMSLRDLYRVIEQPGKNPIRDLQDTLDKAVIEAYGFDGSDQLTQLLQLNLQVSDKENRNEKVQPPGLPEWTKNIERLITNECVKFEK